MNQATDLLVWGIIVHLFCDWILQNHWMAVNKSDLLHRAAIVHMLIHMAGLYLVFHPYVALAIAWTHLLIDTRIPLKWWMGFFRQTGGVVTVEKTTHMLPYKELTTTETKKETIGGADNPYNILVALGGDQVLHITVLAIAAIIQVELGL